MPSVEERVASLETAVDTITDLRTSIVEFRHEMTRAFAQVDKRFEQVDNGSRRSTSV
jgi:hypothetical protein